MVEDDRGAEATRRRLLQAAGATAIGASAATLAACGSGKSADATTTAPASPANQLDAELLNQALDLEYRTIALYTAAVPLLVGRAHAAAKLFLQQELAHVSTLMGYIAQAGGKSHKQHSSYDFGRPRGVRDLFALISKLENDQIAGYVNTLPQLSTSARRGAIASILSNDAQHLSVARLILGRDPVPSAFVTGLG